jgi:hypothetical protein
MPVIWKPTAPGPERGPETESEKSGFFSQKKPMAAIKTHGHMVAKSTIKINFIGII